MPRTQDVAAFMADCNRPTNFPQGRNYRPRRPRNAGAKGQGGPLPLGKRNCSTIGPTNKHSLTKDVAGAGVIWCFLQGGQKLHHWFSGSFRNNRLRPTTVQFADDECM